MTKKLVLATKNTGKIVEIRHLLQDKYDEIVSASDLGIQVDVEEDGNSFEENAIKKALAISEHTDGDVLADDSGLQVDALQGAPGIRSARFAGEHATDEQNNALLLEKMKNVDNRNAQFVCCIVIARKGKVLLSVEGKVRGEIAKEASGTQGFGYDPLFFIPESRMTFAEISMDDKNKISHRAMALKKLQEELQKYEQ